MTKPNVPPNSAQELLDALAYSSGTHEIVHSARLTPIEQQAARTEGRAFTDRHGVCFVVRKGA